ncbi:NAD(P)/FAD-dependent oxidoreductase [Methylobacterium brachythecii]|uniref:Thioredoxin reductase n=1 Tax=Methylobacterium brachythecii TaxID=1176177 RepID=A0A7W6F8M3_9HYPH|nr:NAD(P)/FAD-dependent oxidoreductase [Methylobacterium brachythecii]MBB3904266.1 thioredoxin reductase [Methylobacterium brachythecii]GLS45072.1 hypothetical protein GCM10007884_30610 [Methylobacterium brachythecii]
MRDVIIVGGGPAGLNAALILGRCRRDVLLCDAGRPRNAATPLTWGVFTRDGTSPFTLREQAHADLDRYGTVERREIEVVEARSAEEGFEIRLADGNRETARRLILATGLRQDLPAVEGFETYWGTGVHSCPYCDGYETRDRPIIAYGNGHGGCGLALELLCWSRDVTLCTDGPDASLGKKDRDRLVRNGIRIIETPIAQLSGNGRQAETLTFRDGRTIPCTGVFLMPTDCEPSHLLEQLGCDIGKTGVVLTKNDYEKTNVPGLFVAGDASRRVQFAIVAAAEGAMAAFAINMELIAEDTA